MLLDEHHDEALHIKSPRTFLGLYRDLSRYLRSDKVLLFKSIGFYALTLLILALVSSYILLDRLPRIENIVLLKNRVSKPTFLFVIINSLIYVASFCSLSWVINKAMLLRDENSEEPVRILQGALRKNIATGFKNYLVNFLILYIVYWLVGYFEGFLRGTLVFSDEGALSVYPLNDIANSVMRWLIPALLYVPLLYYSFSTLFISTRENIGASDAFKKVLEISSGQFKKIWLQSLFLLFLVAILDFGIHELFYGLARTLTSQLDVIFFTLTSLIKICSFFLIAFLQVAVVLIFGGIEARPLETLETETLDS